MITKESMENAAASAAQILRAEFNTTGEGAIGIVLGTGFGDKLHLEDYQEIPFAEVKGFSNLQQLDGHDRKFIHGYVGKQEVIGLKGRIHMNESFDYAHTAQMVRLQMQILLELGIKKIILTCSAGALPGSRLTPGDIMALDGFVTTYAPPMPLVVGEFYSPEDTLSEKARDIALNNTTGYPGNIISGGYVMLLGPYFEGRKYDKEILSRTGAKAVGMSMLPEACIASLYNKQKDISVVGLAFISNDAESEHSHEGNLMRAKTSAEALSNYLTKLIEKL